MDPDDNQSRQGDSVDDNNQHRNTNVDPLEHPGVCSTAPRTVGATDCYGSNRCTKEAIVQTQEQLLREDLKLQSALLLSKEEAWSSLRTTLSGENGPSNDEADTELVEVTILCAHNLKNLRCLGRMNPRAELYIDKAFTVSTLIDFSGGTSPHWNYSFWFKIDDDCFQIGHLSIEIYDWSCLCPGGSRLIGTARMPMSDLSGSNWVKEFFSYQVQVPSSGKFQGVVHVLARRVKKAMVQMADPFTDEPWKIYPAGCLEFPYPGM